MFYYIAAITLHRLYFLDSLDFVSTDDYVHYCELLPEHQNICFYSLLCDQNDKHVVCDVRDGFIVGFSIGSIEIFMIFYGYYRYIVDQSWVFLLYFSLLSRCFPHEYLDQS